jgi:hypothetical protein
VVFAGLFIGFLQARHEPPDRQIAVLQLGDGLGAGPALAGALPPGNQCSLALLGSLSIPSSASTSLRMRREIAALRRRISAASSAVGALKSSGCIYASPAAANAAARREAISWRAIA